MIPFWRSRAWTQHPGRVIISLQTRACGDLLAIRPREIAFWQFEQWAVVQKFPIRAETIETKIVARIANFIVIFEFFVRISNMTPEMSQMSRISSFILYRLLYASRFKRWWRYSMQYTLYSIIHISSLQVLHVAISRRCVRSTPPWKQIIVN